MVDLDVKLPVGRMMLGYVIIIALLVLVTVATHFVPAGLYDRVEKVNPETGTTMNVIVPDSFAYVTPNPQGVVDLLISPIKSLYVQGADRRDHRCLHHPHRRLVYGDAPNGGAGRRGAAVY